MNTKTIFIALLFILFLPLLSIAQKKTCNFLNPNENEREIHATFYIDGIKDDLHKKEIWNDITQTRGVQKFIIDNDNKCELFAEKKIDADKIRTILKTHGADFKDGSVVWLNHTDQSENSIDRYPERIDTGNPVQDENTYQIAVKEWQKAHANDRKETNKYESR